jgi:hypothetical protein
MEGLKVKVKMKMDRVIFAKTKKGCGRQRGSRLNAFSALGAVGDE